MVKKVASICWLLACFVSNCTAATPPQQAIRIAILQDAPSLYVQVRGAFQIYDLSSGSLVFNGRNLRRQIVRGYPDKISLKGIDTSYARIKISPLAGAYVYINARAYRGDVNIIRKANKKILVINRLGIEDYIRGILCREVAPWWPMDALKAQAVIARTYAIYHMRFTKDKEYDLTDDIYSQVYGGKTSESWRTNRAVDLTKGQVLAYAGEVFPTYYHATCSGHTEDASILWNIDLPVLKGVACGFCRSSSHFSWLASIPLKEIRRKLEAAGARIADVNSIEILERNSSGRITRLEIMGRDNSLEISAKDFRNALGPNLIRSTNFTVKVAEGIAYFEGLGWGHGVGLCQWGAYFMSREDYNYKQILEYYFPQSKLLIPE